VLASSDLSSWDAPAAWGLTPSLAQAGLNVAAGISREHYDRLVPSAWRAGALLPAAKSALILGSGGMAFYTNALATCPGSPHPLDDFCEAQVHAAADAIEALGWKTTRHFYWERKGEGDDSAGLFADFVKLAEAGGLGTPSRLGLLLHPIYGPWFAIRGLLLSERPLPPVRHDLEPAHAPFDPCTGCEAPCESACPGNAVGADRFSGEDCSMARKRLAACSESCAARLACPIGSEHRYAADAVAHHMRSGFRGDS
jgi:epoxyqueuosine reductase